MLVAPAGQPGHQRQQHAGDPEHQMYPHQPGQMPVLDVLALGQFHERLQQCDGADRHNRRHQFQLQAREIHGAHPARAILVVAGVDLGDKVLVAGKDHDQQQVTCQRQVDQRQRHQDRLFRRHGAQVREVLDRRLHEHEEHGRQRKHQPHIERCHQPSRPEQPQLQVPLGSGLALGGAWGDLLLVHGRS